ncbi:MFS transporter [Streptomyces sp. NPDC087300]|uniref:MFS transporter n=1 Tax=Streptomyces sp. NPDC087300 TaxID=3365780 RepID=UPI00380A1A43
MSVSRGPRVNATALRLWTFMGLMELVPLFPLYPLLFSDHGLSGSAISSLLVLWSMTTFVLEIPSGALGDLMSRRLLLAFSVLLRAGGFGLWFIAPGYWTFAVGFLCWGICDALTSGTLESLVYDELQDRGEGDTYGPVIGTGRAISLLATLTALLLAGPLFLLGGYGLVGAVSVGAGLAGAVTALCFPDPPRHQVESERGGFHRYLATFKAGLGEVRRERAVMRLVLIAAILQSMTAIDEYFPLLAHENGAAKSLIPLLVAIPVLCASVGSWLAGRSTGVSRRTAFLTVAATGPLLLIGAQSHHQWGMLSIAVAFGIIQWGIVVSGLWLQDAIVGAARATITSVAGFGAEVSSVGWYLVAATALTVTDVSGLTSWFSLPCLLIAGLTWFWFPERTAAEPAAQRPTTYSKG